MTELPDFLLLTDEDAAREVKRQDRLRKDFHSRIRLSPVQEEAARAMVIETDLRKALETQKGEKLRQQTKNQLADAVAAQGRFTEAAGLVADVEQKEFFTKAADAVFANEECDCEGEIQAVGQKRIRLPKYRTVRAVYNIRQGQYGYLAECNNCGKYVFMTSNPSPAREVTDAQGKPLNDLDLLKLK